MKIDEVIQRTDILRKQIDALNLTTNNLLRLVPSFRLDWGSDEDRVTDEYNIGVTKPILVTGLANPMDKIKSQSLLTKSNKIAQTLVDTFIIERNVTKQLLLQIHKDIIAHGGELRTKKVFVNDKTYAINSTFSDVNAIDFQLKELIEWYNKESHSEELHPILLSTFFHYNLVRIHPFIDGNGRLARIIASLILLANRIPPPSLRSDERIDYINNLRKADMGDIIPLCVFIGLKVIASMEHVVSTK